MIIRILITFAESKRFYQWIQLIFNIENNLQIHNPQIHILCYIYIAT